MTRLTTDSTLNLPLAAQGPSTDDSTGTSQQGIDL
jgi:hypothetical protein